MTQPEPVLSKMDGIMSLLVTKMVADQTKRNELQEERKEMTFGSLYFSSLFFFPTFRERERGNPPAAKEMSRECL